MIIIYKNCKVLIKIIWRYPIHYTSMYIYIYIIQIGLKLFIIIIYLSFIKYSYGIRFYWFGDVFGLQLNCLYQFILNVMRM